MSPHRLLALIEKELRDVRAGPALAHPTIIALLLLAIPFFIVIVAPLMTGQPLGDGDVDASLPEIREMWPSLAGLSPHATIQAFIFEQFLLLLVVAPIMSATSVAALSIIGEKQEKSLEPLLATPVTTGELLCAKLAASALPAFAVELGAVTLYLILIALTAEPGVALALVNRRTAVIVFVLGPLVTLVALQLCLLTSTRARDPRSAHQWSALIVLPVTGIFIAQVSGLAWLSVPEMLLAGLVLLLIWTALLVLTIRLFDREMILTRWR